MCYKIILPCFLCLLLTAQTGCGLFDERQQTTVDVALRDSFSVSTTRQHFTDLLAADTTTRFVKGKNKGLVEKDFKQLYAKGQLLWHHPTDRDVRPAAQQYLEQLRKAGEHGFKPEQYNLAALEQAYTDLYPPYAPEPLDRLDKLPAFDAQLTASALAYSYDLLRGRITPGGLWDISLRQRNLVAELPKAIEEGKIGDFMAAVSPQHTGYKLLQKELAVQEKKGNTSTVNLIKLNMDRYRLLPNPADLGNRYVWVNIPEYRLQFVDNGDTTASMNVVVGEVKTATPVVINKPLRNVIFSPVWNIPTHIAYEEIEYIVKNPAVLIVADVDVWLDGKKVDPREVDWATVDKKRVKMRQRPKLTNSMGLAKFAFDNNYGVYLHDTPNKGSFGNANRAESHGCVRVGDAATLATSFCAAANGPCPAFARPCTAANNSGRPYPNPCASIFFTLPLGSTRADNSAPAATPTATIGGKWRRCCKNKGEPLKGLKPFKG